jgi:hypothetical protein
MKADRRTFFGLAAGALATAPAAAEALANDLAKVSSGSKAAGYLGEGCKAASTCDTPETPRPDYYLRELADYQKQLSALDAPDTAPYWEKDWHHLEAQRIAGLRSVSKAHRTHMMMDFQTRAAREHSRSWIEREIKRVRERLGVLGHLFE